MTIRLYRTFNPNDNQIIIDDEDAHYLRHVLRVAVGDCLTLCNSEYGAWDATLSHIDKKACTITLNKQISPPKTEPTTKLYFAPLKPDANSFIIEKGCELGVTHFSVVHTDYTQKYKTNIDKINKQIKNAIQQCERLFMPSVTQAQSFTAITKELTEFNANGGAVFIALERSDGISMFDALQSNKSLQSKQPCAILIGPEGGFSARERLQLEKMSDIFHIITLSHTILRAETAALCALSLITTWRLQ